MGRRNAQQFFKRHFAVPVDKVAGNQIFGPLNIRTQYSQYIFTDDGVDYFPIIPMCGEVATDAYFPAWPTGKGYNLDDIESKLERRLDKLSDALKSSLSLNWIEKIFSGLIINSLKSKIIDSTMEAITGALRKAIL